ncbi:M48 family metallopeptidase [Streptomyces triticisoli]|uniref:M48 family metallopeptidase n=1 Tax=Streptomyces triticisoli TaxID=2182797 RepID=UPI000DD5AF63|nr:M48 family metallopeptidase [Streptomyces triticisoli]
MDGRIPEGPQVSPVREWLLIAAMFALAWLPLAGFTLVVLAVGLVWGVWQAAVLPLLWVLPALYGAIVQDALPGRAVRPGEEPELAALIQDMTERTGFRAPLLVRIVPEPTVALGRVKVAGVRTYALLLGLPVLRAFSAAQLAAVIAHELAHQQHVDDRRTRWLLTARGALAERLEGRFRPLAPLAAPLLRATQPRVWQTESAADADAARLVGATATREALERTGVIDEAFTGIAEFWVADLVEDGRYPLDFYDALDLALKDPLVASCCARDAAEEHTLDAYATADHPPPAERVAALPPTDGWTAYGSDPVVLRDADAIARWCVLQLACADDPEAGPASRSSIRPEDLKPVRLLDLDADELRGTADEGPGAQALTAATRQVSPAQALRVALDAVADGHWHRLARRVAPRLRWLPSAVHPAAGRQMLADAMGAALTPLLLRAGWSYASRWMSTVLTAPDGTVVDLYELLVTAVDSGDPAPVRALLEKTGTEEAERV